MADLLTLSESCEQRRSETEAEEMGIRKLHSRMPTFVVLDITISPASIALEEESMNDFGWRSASALR